jgi:hypothetical protein
MVDQDNGVGIGNDETVRIDSFVPRRPHFPAAERARRNLNAKLANPLAGYSHEELRRRGLSFGITHLMGDEDDLRAFEMGAVLAQAPDQFEQVEGLNDQELEALRKEFNNRWSQPKLMYLVIMICSICAAVQGMGMWCDHPPPLRTVCADFFIKFHRRGSCQWGTGLLQISVWHFRD